MASKDPLSGFSIVYFGNDWFAENRTSSHHIARRLAERFPLLYVESPGQRAPTASARDLAKVRKKLAEMVERPRQIGSRLWHATVPQIPFRQVPGVKSFNRAASATLLRRALSQVGFRNYLSWFVAPDAGHLAGRIGEELIVYYVTDNYAKFPGVDGAEVGKLDEELSRKAHQIFVSSKTLLEIKQQVNPHVHHSPHGVDVELFARASDPSTPVAGGAAGFKPPIIGFFGLIERWINLDLVAELAKARPQWTFLMIGRYASPPHEIQHLPNVHFPGPQPYETLPNWARCFDAAIIPYYLTYQVMNANPLKLREYLATGKPVISVLTPDIEPFRHAVRIASTPKEFLEQIEDVLAGEEPDAQRRRQQAVAGLTWDARVEEILSVVRHRIASASML